MKMKLSYGLGILLAVTVWTVGPTVAQNVACYMDQGGAGWHLGSGCTQTVESGGVLDVASGGAFKIAGTDRTTALTTAPAAVAAGYRIARGTATLDGSNPSQVSHGLTTVVACQLTDVRSAVMGLDPVHFTYVVTSGNLDVYAWKHSSSSDPTLIASTDSDDVIAWGCTGT